MVSLPGFALLSSSRDDKKSLSLQATCLIETHHSEQWDSTSSANLLSLELGSTKGCLAVPCHPPTLRPFFTRFQIFSSFRLVHRFSYQTIVHFVCPPSQSRFVCPTRVSLSQSHRDQSALKHYLGTCPLPLPAAPATPWTLNLPSPDSFSCSCNTALNLNSAPALSPCLPGRCSCSCNKSARPPTSPSKRPAAFLSQRRR